MNFTQQKTLAIADQGYSVRATGKSPQTPVALRNTTNQYFEVSRNEIRI